MKTVNDSLPTRKIRPRTTFRNTNDIHNPENIGFVVTLRNTNKNTGLEPGMRNSNDIRGLETLGLGDVHACMHTRIYGLRFSIPRKLVYTGHIHMIKQTHTQVQILLLHWLHSLRNSKETPKSFQTRKTFKLLIDFFLIVFVEAALVVRSLLVQK